MDGRVSLCVFPYSVLTILKLNNTAERTAMFGDREHSRAIGKSTKLDYICVQMKTRTKQENAIVLTKHWPLIAAFLPKDASRKYIMP